MMHNWLMQFAHNGCYKGSSLLGLDMSGGKLLFIGIRGTCFIL
jgi:hypothetical protein